MKEIRKYKSKRSKKGQYDARFYIMPGVCCLTVDFSIYVQARSCMGWDVEFGIGPMTVHSSWTRAMPR